jgi:hypothetical protein
MPLYTFFSPCLLRVLCGKILARFLPQRRQGEKNAIIARLNS